MERLQHISWIKGESDALTCHIHISVRRKSWALTEELVKTTQAFEMRCHRRLLNLSFKDHVTGEDARGKIQAATRKCDEPLALDKNQKLRWFGHISWSPGLTKTVCRVQCKEKDGKVDRI